MLFEMSCEIAREGIRRENPQADAAEVERLLRQRIELDREINPNKHETPRHTAACSRNTRPTLRAPRSAR
jgi:hypothetical protein